MGEFSRVSMLIEEYKALRQESLRSSTILSNTVWISISGFLITIGAFANAAKDSSAILAWLPLLLSIQSISATSMFLSELWKYGRVGVYIKEKIEKSLMSNEESGDNPLYWEHWISDKRASGYYLSVLLLLQLPVFAAIFIICFSLFGWTFYSQISVIANNVTSDFFIKISTIAVVIFDILFTIHLLLKIIKQNKNTAIVNQ
jgi:hypothetical protein